MGEAEAQSPTAALPKPTEADVKLPHLEVLEVNKLLDVSGFTKLCLGWFQSFSLGLVCVFFAVFQSLFGSVRLASNTGGDPTHFPAQTPARCAQGGG